MATTANQLISRQEGDRANYPVGASVTLYDGTAVFLTAAGYADDDTATGANLFGGFNVGGEVVNSGSAGDKRVECLTSGIFELAGTWTQDDVGRKCFASDNFTFSTAYANGSVAIGVVVEYVSSTKARVRIEVAPEASLMFAAIAISADVENTTTETAFDKAFTIPANTLRVGDVIRCRAALKVTDNNSTDTLTAKLKLGSTVVIATAAVDSADADVVYFDVDIVIRTIGASGKFAACGVQANGVPGTVTAKPFVLAETALDTTAAIAVQITGTWSVAHADNEVNLEVFNIEILKRR